MDNPKVLFFDIETSPMLLWGWGLGKQNIGYKQIYKEREVLCIGYAWDDEEPQCIALDYDMLSLTVRDDDADRELVNRFSVIAEEATMVVGHNAKQFDIGVLRSRMVKHQVPDFAPFLIDDTYLGTRSIKFPSHKLDYLTKYLGIGSKEEHPYEMWLDVMMKVPGALDKMVTYCRGDVENNRKLYKRLQPYMKSSLNRAIYHANAKLCPHCGTEDTLIIRGYTASRFPRFQCTACGKYSTLGRSDVKKPSTYPR